MFTKNSQNHATSCYLSLFGICQRCTTTGLKRISKCADDCILFILLLMLFVVLTCLVAIGVKACNFHFLPLIPFLQHHLILFFVLTCLVAIGVKACNFHFILLIPFQQHHLKFNTSIWFFLVQTTKHFFFFFFF